MSYVRVVEFDERDNIVGAFVRDKNKEKTIVVKNLTEKQRYVISRIEGIKNFINANEEGYIHNIYQYNYPYMQELQCQDSGSKNNIHIIRMVILGTFLGEDGYIRYNHRKIKKGMLKYIWDTSSRNSINLTYAKLINIKYIEEDSGGFLMINKNVMINGKVKDIKKIKKVNDKYTYTRLFKKNIQNMFYNTSEKGRKQLANLLKILPFINFKYNVLCLNPTEIDEEKLKLLNWKELTRICGYDESNSTRLKKDLMNLRIYDYEVIGQFETGSGKSICVNPKVFYSGNNIEDIRFLYSMFRMCDNSKGE